MLRTWLMLLAGALPLAHSFHEQGSHQPVARFQDPISPANHFLNTTTLVHQPVQPTCRGDTGVCTSSIGIPWHNTTVTNGEPVTVPHTQHTSKWGLTTTSPTEQVSTTNRLPISSTKGSEFTSSGWRNTTSARPSTQKPSTAPRSSTIHVPPFNSTRTSFLVPSSTAKSIPVSSKAAGSNLTPTRKLTLTTSPPSSTKDRTFSSTKDRALTPSNPGNATSAIINPFPSSTTKNPSRTPSSTGAITTTPSTGLSSTVSSATSSSSTESEITITTLAKDHFKFEIPEATSITHRTPYIITTTSPGGGNDPTIVPGPPFICFGCFPGIKFPPDFRLTIKLPEFCIKILFFEIGNCDKGGEDKGGGDDEKDEKDKEKDKDEKTETEEEKSTSTSTSSCTTTVTATRQSVFCSVTVTAVTNGGNVRRDAQAAATNCVTSAYTTITGCSATPAATTVTTTSTATNTFPPRLCRPETCGGGGVSCEKPPERSSASSKELTRRETKLWKRGKTVHGEWPDPEDVSGDRSRFMVEQMAELRDWEAIGRHRGPAVNGLYEPQYVPHGSLAIVGREFGGMSTSKYVLFGKEPAAIGLEGLYGCTSIIIASQRGAWVNHIWEPQFSNKQEWNMILHNEHNELVSGLHSLLPTNPWRQVLDYAKYGMKDLIGKPNNGPPGTMFGDVTADDDNKDPTKKTAKDLNTRAFILTPREKPTRARWKTDGSDQMEWIPDEEILSDPMNVLAGTIAYQEQIDVVTGMIMSIYEDVDVEVITYSPALATLQMEMERFDQWMARGKEFPTGDEELKEILEFDKYQRDTFGPTPRGKLLLQYQPADVEDCRDQAAWRLWIEDRELGDRSDQWKASEAQTFVDPDSSDESGDESSDGRSNDGSNKLRRRQQKKKKGKSCPVRRSTYTPPLCSPGKCGGSGGSSCPRSQKRSAVEETLFARRSFELAKRGWPGEGYWFEPDDEQYLNADVVFVADQMKHIVDWPAMKERIPIDARGGYMPEYVQHSNDWVVGEAMSGTTTSKNIRFGKDVGAIGLEGLYGCTSIVIVSQRGAWVSHIWEPQLGVKEKWDALIKAKPSPLLKGLHAKTPQDREYPARDHMMYGLQDMIMQPDLGPDGVLFGDVKENGDDSNQKTPQDINVRAFIITPKQRPDRFRWVEEDDGTITDEEVIPDDEVEPKNGLAYDWQVEELEKKIQETFGNVPIEVVGYQPNEVPYEMLVSWMKKAKEREKARGGRPETAEEEEEWRDMKNEEAAEWQRKALAEGSQGKLLLQYQPADPEACRTDAEWRLWIEDHKIGDRSDKWPASGSQTFEYPKAGSSSPVRPRQDKVKACPVYEEERCEASSCGDACPVITLKDVDKPNWMTKRGMPVEGEWPDPEDYPEGRRDRFLINEFTMITAWDASPNNPALEFFGGYDPVWVRHGQPEYVGEEMAGMTTSNHVRFGSQVAAITLGGLYGCTAVVVVSQRGAWVSHIWENQIYTPKEFTALVDNTLPKGIAAGKPGQEWMKYGMDAMVANPKTAPEGVMFGDVKERDDNTKDDAKSTQDIGTRAYIIAPRVRAERFRNGQLVPESEFLNDLNHNVGQIRYPSQVGKLKQRVRDSLGDIPIETLDYSAQALPNNIIEKYEKLRVERVKAGKQETPEEAAARRKECRVFQEEVARKSVRGKLLIQYHPAKTCNDMASWRLWWENRDIGNKYDSWVPGTNQIFQSKNAPRQVCSMRNSTSGTSTATKAGSSRTQKPTGSLAATRSAGSNSTRPGFTGTGSPPRVTTTGGLNATVTRRPGSTGSAPTSGALTNTTRVINSKTTSLNNTATLMNSKTASLVTNTTFINSKTASSNSTTTFNSKTASHSTTESHPTSKTSNNSPRSTSSTKVTHISITKPTHASTTTSLLTSQPKTSTSPPPKTTPPKPEEAKPSQGVDIYYELANRANQGKQGRTGRWVMMVRDSSDPDLCKAPYAGEATLLDSNLWPDSVSPSGDINGRKNCNYTAKDDGPGRFSCDGVSSFDCVKHTGYETTLRCGEPGPNQKSYGPRVTCWFPVK